MRRINVVAGILILVSAGSATAQCRPPASSSEARLLAFYGVPAVFSTDPSMLPTRAGSIVVIGEAAYVPKPNESIRHTDRCHQGRVQNTSLTPVLARPRVAIALPHGFGIEASYLPPVRLTDAVPNLFGAAVWYTRTVRPTLALTVRAHATRGRVRGPVTCPEKALQQQVSTDPCYGDAPSDDEFRPNITGAELFAALAPRGPASRLRVNAGLGVNMLRPEFRVLFADLLGGVDRTTIRVNLNRMTGLLGATVRVTSRCQATAQAYAAFGDATTVRGFASCLVRR